MASVAGHSLLARVLVLCFLITTLSGHAVGGRDVPKDSKPKDIDNVPKDSKSKDVDMKKLDCILGTDGHITIPGIGHGMVSPSYEGANIGTGGGTPRSYIPGSDDTFIPNPGYEVPIGGRNFAQP